MEHRRRGWNRSAGRFLLPSSNDEEKDDDEGDDEKIDEDTDEAFYFHITIVAGHEGTVVPVLRDPSGAHHLPA
jgi:hypothetical protein